MRWRWQWVWAAIGVAGLLGLCRLASKRLAPAVQPMLRMLVWVNTAPSPATIAADDAVLDPDTGHALERWLTVQQGQLWQLQLHAGSLRLRHTPWPPPSGSTPVWQDEAGPAVAASSWNPSFLAIEGRRVLLFARENDTRHSVLAVAADTAPDQWAISALPEGHSLPTSLCYSPALHSLLFLCDNRQSHELELATVPLADVTAPERWTFCSTHQYFAFGAKLLIQGNTGWVATASPSSVVAGSFSLQAEPFMSDWQAATVTGPGQVDALDLALVGGAPAVVCSITATRSGNPIPYDLWFCQAKVPVPARPADWRVTRVYRGFVLEPQLELSDWDGAPVVRFQDFGSDLLVAQRPMPQSSHDWWLCRISEHSTWAESACLVDDEHGLCCAYCDYSDPVRLVRYKSLPQLIPHANDYHGRMQALKQALPLQERADAGRGLEGRH